MTWLPSHTILVDSCCSQRLKLKSIFGNETKVKLDIFHGVQRITRKIPKRHPFFLDCMRDLKMVFRAPTDIGKKRAKDTPDPHTLIESINNFVKKWHLCIYIQWLENHQ